ncbi:MAG: Succinate--CoA ligase [ADP-forming] subunit beta [Elusimicrobia bacterium]|nr:Succinate--CoA ligase [ADP-forming] subunit beta [Elusimicrobiota bacterium]
MKFYEYQAKAIYDRFKIPKPQGEVAFDLKSVPKALKKLGKGPWAIKAQVLAGGRGKAGGVKIVKTPKEAGILAKTLFSKPLVTHQTGPQGEKVMALLIEKSLPKISRELYVSIVLDRKTASPLLMAAKEGGMDIETLAKERPEALHRFSIDPLEGLPQYRSRKIAKSLGLSGKLLNEGASLLSKLYAIFVATDANMVEVNPLAVTESGELMALDGKISTDDNALFRHEDQMTWKKLMPQPVAEKRALKAKISYIKLDGNVGCLVNGAGLAMATMDIIKLHGGEPANFLDVGGGANAEQVTEAFKIILSDKRVEGILVNIFGGIMRCDVIAEGIIAAVKKIKLKVPLVVRLEGNKSEEGKKMLADSKLPLQAATSLSEAAEMIVTAIKNRNKS